MKRVFCFLLLVSLAFTACKKEKRLINLAAYRFKVDEMYEKARKMAPGREQALFSVVDASLTAEEKDAMKFLLAFAPLSDLADYDGQFYLSQVRTTLRAREEMSWGKDIPEDIFLHFVLPLRVNNENLDTFRSACYAELKERIRTMGLHDAALEVNHWCHEKVTYKGSDERTSSPLATIMTSWGRCGEESTFTVAALRAVGIPARQVYTPRWAHTDDNHAWVEIWVDGKWHFMGACEPEAQLDRGWFETPSKRTMLVHTRVYGFYLGQENVIDRQERFSELNLITHYAPAKSFTVRVTDINGNPAKGARVEFRLYNYAEYYPIARMNTGADGKVSVTTGLGDLLIWVTDGENIAYRKISVGNTSEVSLQLQRNHPLDITENLDIVPPPRPEPTASDTSGQALNKRRFAAEDSIRNRYMSTFRDSAWVTAFAGINSLNTDSSRVLLSKSQGNYKNISSFLTKCPGNKRKFALKYLYTLTDKDLRDISLAVLQGHFNRLPPNNYGNSTSEGKGIYLWYVASPRIHNEMIRPWREDIRKHFAADGGGVDRLAAWIKDNIIIDDHANMHSRAPISPAGVLQLKVSDRRSRDIFFVAACRTLGIAARVNSVTLLPEYYSEGIWNIMKWDKSAPSRRNTGFLHFIPGASTIDGRYMQHFTLSKIEKGVPLLYEFEEGKKLSDFPDKTELDTGIYLLTTGNRMSDGGVLSTLTFFRIAKDQITDLMIIIREPRLIFDSLYLGKPDNFSFINAMNGKALSWRDIAATREKILIWLEPGEEPSRHVLVDIQPFKKTFEKWEGTVLFLLRDQKNVKLPDNTTIASLPQNSMFLIDVRNSWIQYVEGNNKGIKPSGLPLVVYHDASGKSWKVAEGYAIGTGDVLGRILGSTK